jgi:histidine ammonia-lyase
MNKENLLCHNVTLAITVLAGSLWLGGHVTAAPEYHPIDPTNEDVTVNITGYDLTIDQVVQVARYGAKVRLSDAARERQADIYALVNEAAAEDVPMYGFNRRWGFLRDQVRFTGDPRNPENRETLEKQALASYQEGQHYGEGPEIDREDVVRAIVLVYTSQRSFRAASPESTQLLIDMLNNRITPVMQSRGGTGEAQGPAAPNIQAAMVGQGEVYYRGMRMAASEALRKARLKPFMPHPSDAALGATNADVAGMSALLVHDARRLLDWIDLTYAIDLNGLNSSLTPLFLPVQNNRPYPWINWVARRVLNMLRGSYLFEMDPNRIIQDPESMRAGYVREGATWRAWQWLHDDVVIQVNGSDGNPAQVANVRPEDSWELSTPWAMHYYVEGRTSDRGTHGFVFSNANWDPYPLGNSLEAFTIALANLDVLVLMRQERFERSFHTRAKAHEILGWGDDAGGIPRIWNSNHESWQRIQGWINPVPPEGYSSDPEYVQDLDAETLFKVERAVQVVHESWKLVANDLLSGARWMDVRKAQEPSRKFGSAPTTAVAALRQIVPLEPRQRSLDPGTPTEKAIHFIQTTPAADFITDDPPMPD